MQLKRIYKLGVVVAAIALSLKAFINTNIKSFDVLLFLVFAIFVTMIMGYFTILVGEIKFDFTETVTLFIYLMFGVNLAVVFEFICDFLRLFADVFYKEEEFNLCVLYNKLIFPFAVFLSGSLSGYITSYFNLPFIQRTIFLATIFEFLFLNFNILFILLDGKKLRINLNMLLFNFIVAVILGVLLYFIDLKIGKYGTFLMFIILITLSYCFYLLKRLEFKNIIIKNILSVSEGLIKHGDLKIKCDNFLLNLKRILPYDVAAIYFFDYEGDDVVLPISFYCPKGLNIDELDLNIRNGYTIKVILEGEIYISRNIRKDKKVLIIGSLLNFIKTAIFVPIMVDNKLRGLIFLGGKIHLPNLLLYDIKEPLSILAKQMSLAFNNYSYFLNIKKETEMDALTGLYNRRKLNEEVNNLIRENMVFSIAIFDIDNFKKINDTYGHLVGDKILMMFADIVKKLVRKTDVVCRYGGEEIVIILNGLTKEQAYLVAERIRKYIQEYEFIVDNYKIDITISGGVTSFPEDANNMMELIQKADSVLYKECKAKGKNKVAVYLC